jgi:Holliday junction resolvase RusA-like endonuclease
MVDYPITPVPKPRMTRSDRWKKRPAVLRYFAFKDQVREMNVQLPVPYKVVFHIEMPKSWSKKKRAAMNGQPHLQKPDKDNLEKSLLDSVFEEDSHVWSGWTEKRWAETGFISIERIEA